MRRQGEESMGKKESLDLKKGRRKIPLSKGRRYLSARRDRDFFSPTGAKEKTLSLGGGRDTLFTRKKKPLRGG